MSLNPFKAAELHPASWWLLGLALATAASLGKNSISELVVIASAVSIMLTCRENAPWARSIRFYLFLATFVVGVRVLFRIIFNSGLATEKIAFVMPELNVGGVHLLGAVAWPTLLAATNDGLRLAAIIVTIGMANTLANPKRLLKSTPGALYEVATAMTVAINLAPQLIESLQRVRKARNLRGRSKGISALHSIVIPALEDTIEQSLALAASMDARGFGRRGNLTSFQTVLSRALSLGGILLITFGAYFLLATNMQVLAISLFAIGVAALAVTIKIASSRNLRTRYRRQKPGWRDGVIALASLTAVALAVFV